MKLKRTTSNKLLKSINQQKVLRLIYIEGPISRVELAEKTGLTQQTITNIVNRLLDDDVIMETEPVASSGGRKPVPLVVKATNMYAIGIEIAVRYIRGTLMDFQNRAIQEVTEAVPVYQDEEQPLTYIKTVIDQLLEHVPKQSRLKGIGCSIQGLVDSKSGVVIYSPGLRWRNFPLRERLEQHYKLPVYLENDVNLLALVENLKGSLASSHNNIVVKLDYGIGGAIVMNKQLCTGASHVAGEFGHYKAFTGDDAKPCHCGSRGCLTTLASISGLFRNSGYSLDEFQEQVRAKEPRAVALFHKIEEAVGMAISNAITLFNPDHVLLTGKFVDEMGELLIPLLTQHIAEMVPETCGDVTLLRLPETPNESTTAVGLVMDRFFNVPIDRLSL